MMLTCYLAIYKPDINIVSLVIFPDIAILIYQFWLLGLFLWVTEQALMSRTEFRDFYSVHHWSKQISGRVFLELFKNADFIIIRNYFRNFYKLLVSKSYLKNYQFTINLFIYNHSNIRLLL
ncbi:hypothetical protein NIES2100_29200 [Calothrix sp. NIES-2100]|nr:hypothetical protein NIES2100_29200 [Calothrix sp. NIES-2100]